MLLSLYSLTYGIEYYLPVPISGVSTSELLSQTLSNTSNVLPDSHSTFQDINVQSVAVTGFLVGLENIQVHNIALNSRETVNISLPRYAINFTQISLFNSEYFLCILPKSSSKLNSNKQLTSSGSTQVQIPKSNLLTLEHNVTLKSLSNYQVTVSAFKTGLTTIGEYAFSNMQIPYSRLSPNNRNINLVEQIEADIPVSYFTVESNNVNHLFESDIKPLS